MLCKRAFLRAHGRYVTTNYSIANFFTYVLGWIFRKILKKAYYKESSVFLGACIKSSDLFRILPNTLTSLCFNHNLMRNK